MSPSSSSQGCNNPPVWGTDRVLSTPLDALRCQEERDWNPDCGPPYFTAPGPASVTLTLWPLTVSDVIEWPGRSQARMPVASWVSSGGTSKFHPEILAGNLIQLLKAEEIQLSCSRAICCFIFFYYPETYCKSPSPQAWGSDYVPRAQLRAGAVNYSHFV